MDLMAPKMDQFLQTVSSLTGTTVHIPQVCPKRRAGHPVQVAAGRVAWT